MTLRRDFEDAEETTMKTIEVGNLHDGSDAKTLDELVRYWREDADRFWNSDVLTNNQTISAVLRNCADNLERVLVNGEQVVP